VAPKFVTTKDKRREFRVTFKYNAERIFQAEGYSDKSGAHRLIEAIKKYVPGAEIEDATG
jgi:uncharacterized protein YegP (UPF0339 family)